MRPGTSAEKAGGRAWVGRILANYGKSFHSFVLDLSATHDIGDAGSAPIVFIISFSNS